ncbi:MAG: two-component regulator propeller domain-containing protein, partial [Thermoanaerobaculia bacterium]|nr:two-component regulator propeller domain-containing protein [Thermoanaerobaculia bacterium]
HRADDAGSLANDDVRSVLLDPNHNLWVGTRGGGVSRLDLKPRKFDRFLQEQVKSLEALSASRFWAGTLNGLVEVREGRARRLSFASEEEGGLPHAIVQALELEGEKYLWIGTFGGLDLLDLETGSLLDPRTVRPEIPATALTASYEAILLAPDGTLWLGTRSGLWGVPGQGPPRHFGRGPGGLDDDFVRSLYREPGTLWIGTDSGGVHRLDLTTWEIRSFRHRPEDPRSLSDDRVYAVLRHPSEGSLWVGTDYGLNRLGEEGGFHRMVEDLPDPTVVALLGSQGQLWVATYRGVARLDLEDGAILTFDASDGLQGSIFSNGAFTRAPDGILFFGGRHGVNRFRPARIRRNPVRPPVHLTDIRRPGRPQTRSRHFLPPPSVELGPDQRSITFEVAALDFTNPERNRYRFRLEGHESEWIETGNQRTVTFTGLSPGEYSFRAQATNSDGIWNRDGLEVPVRVRPAFWEARWFHLLLLLGLIGAVLSAHRLRLRSIHRRNERLESLVRERTHQLDQRRREAERERGKQELINRIVHLIHQEIEFEDLVRAILEGLSFAGSAERGLALVPREEGGHRVIATTGWLEGSPEGASLPPGDLERYLADTREIAPGISVGLPAESRLRAEERVLALPAASILALQIDFEEETLGYLILANSREERAFHDSEVETLQALRPHVTSAFLKGRIMAALRRLNEQKSEFLGMAAHDLRSPLGGVISQVDLLRSLLREDRRDEELWDRFLSNVRTAAEGMLTLIDDLLDVASIESGRVKLERSPVRLADILEEKLEV